MHSLLRFTARSRRPTDRKAPTRRADTTAVRRSCRSAHRFSARWDQPVERHILMTCMLYRRVTRLTNTGTL